MNRMDSDDLAFVQWAAKRHRWLWSLGFGPKRLKSSKLRAVAVRAAVASMRLDRVLWRSFAAVRPF